MSDQSPWGSPPPPNNPFGSPTQPPQQPGLPPTQQPGQPAYPQPGQQGGGYGGGSPYGSPYGGAPQPPRNRLPIIVGIVVAVLLVGIAFTITLLVAGGDDEPESASSSEPTSETSDPTDDPTSETSDPTSEPTESTSIEPTPDSDADTIAGDGYTFDLPAAGWTDQTEAAQSQSGGATIDKVVVLGESIEFSQSNVIVEALSASGASSVDDLANLWKRNLSGTDGATPVDIDETTIDGERAIGVRIDDRVNAAGAPIIQIAYLAIHEGFQYSIGLSYPAEGDTVSADDFDSMLSSWTWTR